MIIFWTRHAKNRMRWYQVTQAEVIGTISLPDRVQDGEYGKKHAWKRRGRGALRVTYKDEQDRRVIITVTPKRKFSGGG